MKWSRSILAPLTGIVVMLIVWETIVRVFEIRRFVLLAPTAILSELASDPSAYWDNTLVTARHMVIGLTISMAIALVVGSIMAASRFIDEAIQPIFVVILVTPWVAYATSIVIWLGFGDRPIIFLAAFVTFPILTIGVVAGMRGADPAARELLSSVNASKWEVLWHLRLPSALPTIFTTSRIAVAIGLGATYYAEGSSLSTSGLGAVGRRAALDQTRGAEVLWTTTFCAAALGIAALVVVSLSERFLLRWHASQRA
jgi:NitT/TauT family transport system permease protein